MRSATPRQVESLIAAHQTAGRRHTYFSRWSRLLPTIQRPGDRNARGRSQILVSNPIRKAFLSFTDPLHGEYIPVWPSHRAVFPSASRESTIVATSNISDVF